MQLKRLRRNEHGEPVVTITLTSEADIFRWAFTLLHQQVEFMEVGSRILQAQRRRLGAEEFDAMDRQMTGGRAKSYAIRRGRDD